MHGRTISVGSECSYLAFGIAVVLAAYTARGEYEHMKLVLTVFEVELFSCIGKDSPSHITTLRALSRTNPCARISQPTMISYCDLGLLNDCMQVLGIV